MKHVAIQGFEGCFHELATRGYYAQEEVTLDYCATFEQVFAHLADHTATHALVAIENTIAGSLLHNYELLCNSNVRIVGEKKIHISHCICCLPTDTWETLHEVHSHPVALMQCRHYLEAHPTLKAVEAADTAGAASQIAVQQLHGQAAICNAMAAERLGMKILQNHIEDNKHNYTRFLVLSPDASSASFSAPPVINKASLAFTLPHERGSLSMVLSIFSYYGINLTKIQSLPIIGREWEYMFYIDLAFDNYTKYKQSLEAVRPLTSDFKNLGEYADDTSR